MTGTDLAERLSLVVITDPRCGPGRTIVEVVRAALGAGAPAVQLRAKGEDPREMLQLGHALRTETDRTGALLFVNDRVDVALAIGAHGAHLGEDDLPISAARRIVPAGFLLGRSVDTAEEAAAAEGEGADYLGIGPVFGTPSKTDAAEPIGVEGIARTRLATRLPLVAIGGLDVVSSRSVAAAGAEGVAVIRAVMEAADPAAATRDLLAAVAEGRRSRSG
jgi:thiamine-phosphate pyrophosphorylase